MNFNNLLSGSIGMIHLLFSILSLVLGTIVLLKQKGSNSHKRIGYLYCIAMVGVNVTALMIYRLYGKFGMFHWMAVLSLLTLVSGMLPMMIKKPTSYVSLHFNFMYWSVIGLYAAFIAETLVRIPDIVIEKGIPNSVFYNMVGIAVGITMAIGIFVAIKKRKKWSAFDKSIIK